MQCLKTTCHCLSLLALSLFLLLTTFMVVLMYPQQYYSCVAPFIRTQRTPQHLRIIDNVKPHQVMGLLQHAYHSDFPLVVRGGVKHWPATNAWSPTHISDSVGDDTEIVLQSGVQEQQASPFTRTTMGAFATWLDAQDNRLPDKPDKPDKPDPEQHSSPTSVQPHKVYYLAEEFDFIERHDGLAEQIGIHELDHFWQRKATDNSLGSWFESLLMAIGVGYDGPKRSNSLEAIENSEGFETAFWMGGAGARTGWHIDHDYPLNVLCHLKGTKTLWIASPEQSNNMYPSNKYDPGAVLGQVNFWEPNYHMYPNYRNVTYEQIVLHPGDVLFIPMGYWHAAESTTYTTSVSLRSMTAWYWMVNYPDRLLEWLFFNGWWTPSHGSTANETTEHKVEL